MTLLRVLIPVLLVLGVPRARAQDTITLRPEATLAASGPVMLSQVATLAGSEAEKLAATVVGELRRGQESLELRALDVRQTLERRPGVPWGRLSFTGGVCRVRLAPASLARTESQPAHPATLTPVDPGSIRALVLERIAQMLYVEAASVRATFDAADSAVLDRKAEGLSVVVQPAGLSDRMTLSVRAYEGERLAINASVRAAVLIERDVAIARAPLARGETLTESSFSLDRAWLAPSLVPANPKALSGCVARARVDAGKTILAKDVESPVLVRKGDSVAIDCVSGSFVVRLRARALKPAREGETIEFQSEQTPEKIRATVTGPGRASVSPGDPGAVAPQAADTPSQAPSTPAPPAFAASPRSPRR